MVGSVVLWDFDGTLAVRTGMWRGALLEALTKIAPQHAVTAAELAPGLQDGFPWHQPDIAHPALNSPDAWWRALQPLLTSAYARAGVDVRLAEQAAHAVRACYTDPERWTLFPDSVDVLEELTAAGWRHVIVSNHVPELEGLLKALGLARHFTAVVNSSRVGWEKPHRRIFDTALEQAGHPQRVWMVGDNPVADIAGARAARIPGILVNPSQHGLRPVIQRILEGTTTADPHG